MPLFLFNPTYDMYYFALCSSAPKLREASVSMTGTTEAALLVVVQTMSNVWYTSTRQVQETSLQVL